MFLVLYYVLNTCILIFSRSFATFIDALTSWEKVNSTMKSVSVWALMALHGQNSMLNLLNSTIHLTTLPNVLILCRISLKNWSKRTLMLQA